VAASDAKLKGLPEEPALPDVFGDGDIDRLLERLRAVHGEPGFDVARGLTAARSASYPRQSSNRIKEARS